MTAWARAAGTDDTKEVQMMLKVKNLVLASTAVVAMSATMASAAHAGQFTAEAYPATMTGTQLTNHQFQFLGGAINCAASSFHGTLEAAAGALTTKATYAECATAGGAGIAINMTSCDYVLHAGETLENDRVDGSIDVQCAQGGDEIDIVEPATGCAIGIPAQQGLTTLVYTNHTVAKDFDIDMAVTEMEYTQNANCPGGEGVFFNGEYSGQITMTADFGGAGIGTKVD
jgi:hypothetical protein